MTHRPHPIDQPCTTCVINGRPAGRKVYLGDSVYADFDGYMVTLTTENGMGPSNTIHLEPEVSEALVDYFAGIYGKKREAEGE